PGRAGGGRPGGPGGDPGRRGGLGRLARRGRDDPQHSRVRRAAGAGGVVRTRCRRVHAVPPGSGRAL
ncbi:hypothetical protein EF910_35215, partial [Streptomyces sp. WAC07149]